MLIYLRHCTRFACPKQKMPDYGTCWCTILYCMVSCFVLAVCVRIACSNWGVHHKLRDGGFVASSHLNCYCWSDFSRFTVQSRHFSFTKLGFSMPMTPLNLPRYPKDIKKWSYGVGGARIAGSRKRRRRGQVLQTPVWRLIVKLNCIILLLPDLWNPHDCTLQNA